MLPLRLFVQDDDALLIQLDVPGLDVSGLLRAAARMPNEQEQVAERVDLAWAGQEGLEVPGAIDLSRRRAGGFLIGLAPV